MNCWFWMLLVQKRKWYLFSVAIKVLMLIITVCLWMLYADAMWWIIFSWLLDSSEVKYEIKCCCWNMWIIHLCYINSTPWGGRYFMQLRNLHLMQIPWWNYLRRRDSNHCCLTGITCFHFSLSFVLSYANADKPCGSIRRQMKNLFYVAA